MPHLRSLTALRFGAALLVFCFHATAGDPLSPFAGGYVGVTVFFVLSGFVLTWGHEAGTSVRRFYWRRFARVWPLHALVVLLMVAYGLQSAGGGSIAANLALLRGFGASEALNPPSWSLSAEAFFYLLFPALLIALTATSRLRGAAIAALVVPCLLAIVLGAIVGPGRLDVWTYMFPVVRLGEFALGMTVAVGMKRGWRPPSLSATLLGAVVAYAALLQVDLDYWVGAVAMGPAFALVIASCAQRDIERRWVVPEFAIHAGKWSFAFYLVHWPVLELVGTDGVSAVLLAGGLTLVVAALLHVGFEKPVERWLRSLGRWPVPAPAPARP